LLAANLTSTTASPASAGTALSSGSSLTCSVERFLIPSSIFSTPF